MMMQALVIAHACYGHNSFFKGNYLFQTWTDAEGILDYLVFARNYIADCEERYGQDRVELLLDSCHALMNHGVDRYKRPSPLSMVEEQQRMREREEYLQSRVNELWRTLPPSEKTEKESLNQDIFPKNRRKTCSISSRSMHRDWKPGSGKLFVLPAKSPNISTRNAKPR